jgi:transcriptional regulator with XRE-family HTH domain
MLSFKGDLLREIRQSNSMKQIELANLLGVSESHIYKLERGLKQPSLDLVRKISAITGVPSDTLLSRNGGEIEGGGVIHSAVSGMRDKLAGECKARKRAEKLNARNDRVIERLTNIVELHVKFENILLSGQYMDKREISQKLQELAKDALREGKASPREIRSALRIGRVTFRNLLRGEKRAFPCKFAEGGQIMASTPGEAALRLCCFDCAAFESGECEGHGAETRPENIVDLISRLEANGVTQKREQSRILDGSYCITLSPHEISEVMYRARHGMDIPEGLFYLEMTKHRNRK